MILKAFRGILNVSQGGPARCGGTAPTGDIEDARKRLSRPRSVLRVLLGCFLLSLSGCGIAGLPTQNNPSCSWGTQIPANATTLCTTAFTTLSALVRAEVTGNDAAIHRLVSNKVVAGRIIVFGRQQRANHINFLHVVPSITLGITNQGLLGAGFFIVGQTHAGKVSAPETVYMRLRRNGTAAIVVEDQPDQEW